MYQFKKVSDLQRLLDRYRAKGLSIGFTPTMGALHRGHLSLIESSLSETQVNVCSIFVNPTQFNDPSDLKKYPRTRSRDIELLTQASNHIVFIPRVEEVYPPGLDTSLSLDFGQLAEVLEGQFRPGHFDGMAQVVKRLLEIVGPDKLYMGQKDFQQFCIVRNMIKQLQWPIEIVMCPIVREEDGLALSSRNVRLTPENRSKAPLIRKTLLWAKEQIGRMEAQKISTTAMKKLQIPGFKPEYFELVDGHSLQSIEKTEACDFVVACTAVWAGNIRLIDNEILKGP